MTTSGSYFLSKFGRQEGWEKDYNKITLLDRPQDFTNKDYWELSKIFKDYTHWQLFKAMQKMFLPTPDDNDKMGSRFNKFRKTIGKLRDDLKKNWRQSNYEENFLGQLCT